MITALRYEPIFKYNSILGSFAGTFIVVQQVPVCVIVSDSNCACPRIVRNLPTNGSLELKSQNYPDPHCHLTECYYLLVAEENKEIQIEIQDLDLEVYDFLDIYDGNSTTELLNR